MPRQFAKVRILPNGVRDYTYHWDGVPLAVGDLVKVPDKFSSDGAWIRGEVTHIGKSSPPFATVGILGLVEGKAQAAPQGDLFGAPVKAPYTAPAPPYVAQRRRKAGPNIGPGTGRNPNRLGDAG